MLGTFRLFLCIVFEHEDLEMSQTLVPIVVSKFSHSFLKYCYKTTTLQFRGEYPRGVNARGPGIDDSLYYVHIKQDVSVEALGYTSGCYVFFSCAAALIPPYLQISNFSRSVGKRKRNYAPDFSVCFTFS